MTLAEALLALLLKYHSARVPERYWGESATERRARLGAIVRGNIAACRRVKLPRGWTFGGCLAILTVTEQWESGLVRSVHEGTKRGPGGEKCLVQIHRLAVGRAHDPDYVITEEEWESLGGLSPEATERCAFAGAKALMYHASRCSVPFAADSWWMAARVFAEYHTPSNLCAANVSSMSSQRGMSYAILYRKLLPDLEN